MEGRPHAYLNHPALRDGDAEVERLWSAQHVGLRSDPKAPLDRRVRHNVERVFDIQSLNRFGK